MQAFAYTVTAPLVNFIQKRITRTYLSFLAFFIFAIALMIEGPSEYFDLDDEASMVIFGNAMLGIAGAMALVPLFSTIIDSVREKEQIFGKSEILQDKTSAIFNMCFAFGSVLAPILGGVISDLVGFEHTCDIMMVLAFAFGAFFFFAFILPELLKEKQEIDQEYDRE